MLAWVLAVVVVLFAKQPLVHLGAKQQLVPVGQPIKKKLSADGDMVVVKISDKQPMYIIDEEFILYTYPARSFLAELTVESFEMYWDVGDQRLVLEADLEAETLQILIDGDLVYYVDENYEPNEPDEPEPGEPEPDEPEPDEPEPDEPEATIPVMYIGGKAYMDMDGVLVPLADFKTFYDKYKHLDDKEPTEAVYEAYMRDMEALFKKAAYVYEDDSSSGLIKIYAAKNGVRSGNTLYIFTTENGKQVVVEADENGGIKKDGNGNTVVVGGMGEYNVDSGTLTDPNGNVTNLNNSGGFKQLVPTLGVFLILFLLV